MSPIVSLYNNQLIDRSNGRLARYICTATHTESEQERAIILGSDVFAERYFLQAIPRETLDSLLEFATLRDSDYFNCFLTSVPPAVRMNDGVWVQHFKGNRYQLVLVTDLPEKLVVYRNCDATQYWARPISSFTSFTPDGKARFTYLIGPNTGNPVVFPR